MNHQFDEYREIWNGIIYFVDEFRRNPSKKIKKPPYRSVLANSFYAGVVEFLTREQNVKPPLWVFDKKYYLKNPWFPDNIKNGKYRIMLMIESPLEFKTRNIFIGENTFSRC